MNAVPVRRGSAMRPLLLLLALAPLAAADKEPALDGKTFAEWVTLLRDSDNGRVRRAAVAAVGQIASERADDPKLLKEAVVAAGKAMRNDSSAGVRAEAARALAKLAADLVRDKSDACGYAVQDLAEGIRGEREPDVRYEQAVALQRYAELAKPAVTALGAAAADKDPKVQAAAAVALGRVGKDGQAATDDLLPLVKSPDAEVRKAAVFALGRIDPKDIVAASEAISRFTTDPDEQTRKEAISSLTLLKDKSPDTVKAVAAALADKSVEVRRLAAAGLARFEGGANEAQAELLAAFKKDGEDKLVKAYALHSLCVGLRNEDPSKVLPDVIARLDPLVEKDADVRQAVCDEIGGLGPDAQSAVPKLREAERDPEKAVREAAKFALKKVIAKKEEKK